MKYHFIYRSSPENPNGVGRPEGFSKYRCLRTFLKAYHHFGRANSLKFVNDGVSDPGILELMHKNGEILKRENLGNIGSLNLALSMAIHSDWPDSDFIYFSEDDYFYLPNAFSKMADAVDNIASADYFSLYDHPDRYRRKDDADGGKANIFVTNDHHWRTCESTCQTYGVRLGVLRRDFWIMKFAMLPKNTPRGREMFRAIQGLGKYFWKRPKHTLITPIPSLATHATIKAKAPVIDWDEMLNNIL